MKRFTIFACLCTFVIVSFISCAPKQVATIHDDGEVHNYAYFYQEATSRVLETDRSSFLMPVVGEMEIGSKRLSYTEEFDATMQMTRTEWLRFQKECNEAFDKHQDPKKVRDWKTLTALHALIQFQADDLFAPTFLIETDKQRKVVKVTLSAYPVTYTHFHKVTEKEIPILKEFYNLK